MNISGYKTIRKGIPCRTPINPLLLLFVKYKIYFANMFVNILTFTHIFVRIRTAIAEGAMIMESRTYYYARVSSKEQNLDRQIAAFKALGAQ